jgi:hypothetical protein
VERVLGKGGFGLVYLAHDDQLHPSWCRAAEAINLVVMP